MCADFIDFEVFQRGLTSYLKDHTYGNANQNDLWSALQTQVDLENVKLPTTIKEIMDTWTYKMDFSFIRVTRDYQTDGANVKQVEIFTAKKQRFYRPYHLSMVGALNL
ncbi:hypothetical protein OUZ56_028682 [Daphnia magna]|uniref:Peptidase M1 membrane alanine aminopeptidase domain-containing protein n=1 Tax=Daphnia magna TaxID=35525 RepID=A0ABR0B4L1_9CRUS|nr:hypothetical protein OUZ56_028682 [Daphnia magna]